MLLNGYYLNRFGRWPLLALLLAASVCGAQPAHSDPERLFNEAMAAQKRGDLQAAIAGYERVLKLMPGLTAAHINLAIAEMQLGQTDAAIENYRAAVRQEPNNVRFTLLLGDAYVSQRRYAEAVGLLEPVEKAHPDNLDVAFVLGEALIDINRPAQGLKRIERVATTRNDANAWTLAALTHLRLAEYVKARANAESALRVDPSSASTYVLSGIANAGLGDMEAAKAAYQKAIQLEPDNFDANLRLGALLLRDHRDAEAARPYLERAYRLNPGSLSAIFEMGQLAVADKRDADAIGYFETVVQRAPNLLEPHVRLAVLYARAHRSSDASHEKETVDHLMAEQQKQDPNALPEDLLAPHVNGPPPSH